MISKAVLIGFGHHGKKRLFQSLLHLEQIGEILIYDINPEVFSGIEPLVDGKKIHVTSRFDEVLAFVSTDVLVVVGTTARDHFSIIKELAMRHVKYVYMEKPLAQSMAECDAMAAIFRNSGMCVAVGFYNDFIPLLIHRESLEREYNLGKLLKVSSEGGAVCLSTNGVHIIDLANLLFGSRPLEVYGHITSRIKNPRGDEYFTHGGLFHALYDDGRELLLSYSNDSLVSHSILLTYEYGFIRASYDDEFLRIFGLKAPLGDWPKYRYQTPVELHQVSNKFNFNGCFDTILHNLLNGGTYCGIDRAISDMSILLGAFASDSLKRSVALPLDTESDLYHERFPIT